MPAWAFTCPPPPPPPAPLFAVPPAPPPPTTKTSAAVTLAGTLHMQVPTAVNVLTVKPVGEVVAALHPQTGKSVKVRFEVIETVC